MIKQFRHVQIHTARAGTPVLYLVRTEYAGTAFTRHRGKVFTLASIVTASARLRTAPARSCHQPALAHYSSTNRHFIQQAINNTYDIRIIRDGRLKR